MFANSSSKKRKMATGTDGKTQARTYLENITKNFNIYKNKDQFLASMAGNPKRVATIQALVYRANIASPPITLMPVFNDVTYTRDGESMVIEKITFKDKSIIKGVSLLRLGASWRLRMEGFEGLIWENEENDCLGAYLIQASHLETWQRPRTSKDEAEGKVDFEACILARSVKKLYVPISIAFDMMNQDYISLAKMREVLDSANAIAKADSSFQFNLGNLQQVLALKDKETGRHAQAFYSALLGAHMETASLSDRVNAFLSDPTMEMCNAVRIPKAYGKTVFNRELKVVEKIPLLQVSDDTDLYLSDQIINSALYGRISFATSNVYVVDPSSPPCVRNGGRYQEIEGLRIMKAGDYKRIVTAIVQKRSKKSVETKKDESDSDSSSSSDDEENATFF